MSQEVVSVLRKLLPIQFMCLHVQFYALLYTCFPAQITHLILSYLSSAFKACHPKVKSFYFAADGVDDMNR